jgi:hydrogenase maturation protease
MDDTHTTLIVGLGNPILTDDGVGWRVAQGVRERLSEEPETSPLAHVQEACVGGLALAEMLVGYHRALVIDAIMTQGGTPGTIYHLKLSELPGTLNTASAHDTNLNTALRALRRFGAVVPCDDAIDIIAIEVQDVLSFGEQCTPVVEASIPAAVEQALDVLSRKK